MGVNYIQPELRDILEFKAINAAYDVEFERLRQAAAAVRDNFFIESLDETGCQKWEKIQGLTAKGTDSIAIRRFRILSRMNEQLPYTFNILDNQLSVLCGVDGYSFAVDYAAREIAVRVALTAKGMYDEIENLLLRIRPANMVIDLSLLYNQWITISTKRWSELSTKTWYQVRNEVV